MRRNATTTVARAFALPGALFLAAISDAAAQCAMCGTAMGSRGGFARGFFISVLFLLGTLGVLIAGLVGLIRARNRALHPGS